MLIAYKLLILSFKKLFFGKQTPYISITITYA